MNDISFHSSHDRITSNHLSIITESDPYPSYSIQHNFNCNGTISINTTRFKRGIKRNINSIFLDKTLGKFNTAKLIDTFACGWIPLVEIRQRR